MKLPMPSISWLTPAERVARRARRRRVLLLCSVSFLLGVSVAAFGCALINHLPQ
jgi:hypothetical protein